MNRRELWHDLIKAYNSKDKARLAKDIISKNDCYVGMRSKEEFDECVKQGLFTHYIWVDASERKEPEDVSSCTLRREHFLETKGSILITNNLGLDELYSKLDVLANKIKPTQTDFAKFFISATVEKREKVFNTVMQGAIEDQRKILNM